MKQTVCKQPRKTMVQGSLDQINKAGDFDSDALRSALQSAMEEKLKKDFANTDTVGNVEKKIKNVGNNVGGDYLVRTMKRSPGVASDIWGQIRGQINKGIDTVKKIPIQFDSYEKIDAPEKRILDFKILNEKVEQYFNEKPEPKLQNPSEGSIPLYFNLPTLPQVIQSYLQLAREEKLKKDFAKTDTVGNVGQRVKNVAKDVGGDFFKNLGRTKKRSPGVASAIQFGKIVAPEKRIQDFKILNEKVEQYFNKYLEPNLQNPSEGSIPLYFNLPTLPQGNVYYL